MTGQGARRIAAKKRLAHLRALMAAEMDLIIDEAAVTASPEFLGRLQAEVMMLLADLQAMNRHGDAWNRELPSWGRITGDVPPDSFDCGLKLVGGAPGDD